MNLKEIAQELQVPESTLRLYRDEFEDYVPATGEGRRRRYTPAAAVVLKRIVDWKREGIGSTTIRQELAKTQVPQEIRRVATLEERITQLLVTLEGQNNQIVLLRAEVGGLRTDIGRLIADRTNHDLNRQSMEEIQRRLLRSQ